jgi:membrane associated rhomboid family serine protease
MGIHDRPYYGDRSGGLGTLAGLSATAWLIIANTAVFVAVAMGFTFLYDFGYFSTWRLFGTAPNAALPNLEFWRLVTFQFLHANLVHLLFNMIGLYFFGRLVESHVGPRRYLAFYLTCGIFGGLCYLLLNLLGQAAQHLGLPEIGGLLFNDPRTPLVGASAGVFGIIMACAYIAPNTTVQLLIPPVPLRMKTFAYVFLGLAAANLLLFRGPNQGGDAAHVGGALAGYFFIRNIHLLRDFFDVFTDSRKAPPRPRGRGFFSRDRSTPRQAADNGPSDAEIDRILEKVSAQGLHSLTDREKALLRQASERRRSAS